MKPAYAVRQGSEHESDRPWNLDRGEGAAERHGSLSCGQIPAKLSPKGRPSDECRLLESPADALVMLGPQPHSAFASRVAKSPYKNLTARRTIPVQSSNVKMIFGKNKAVP